MAGNKTIDERIADEHERHVKRMEKLISKSKPEEITAETERYTKKMEMLLNRKEAAEKRSGNMKKVHDDAVKIRIGGIMTKYFPELYQLEHTKKQYFHVMDDYFGERLDAIKNALPDLQDAINRENQDKPE